MLSHTRTLRIKLAYDGSEFSGWQVQPGKTTVQGKLEQVFSTIDDQPVHVTGSGRTDAGVHALGQVASCELHNPIPIEGLVKAVNRLLPPSIRVLEATEMQNGFHARYAAITKTYEYRIYRSEICPPFKSRYVYWYPYPLDEAAMIEACKQFIGTRDFCSFASLSHGNEPSSAIRTVNDSKMTREGEILRYRIRGTGFLYRMVRNIIGTLLDVGRGNLLPVDIVSILKACDRSAAGPTAPARGLYLVSVEYPEITGQENLYLKTSRH